jgi:heme o synthase
MLAITKFRLSFLVLTTTLVGYLLGAGDQWFSPLLLHTLIGSAAAAFGAAVFNQLLEIVPDSKMERTRDRPLPSGRMNPFSAFVLGGFLSALGVLHLVSLVNLESGALAAATLGVYIFVYTPMKKASAWNTVVGAISGALPPLIGWTGSFGVPGVGQPNWRWELLVEPTALFLFLLLFFWQMPHFIAINWLYREEYERGGFIMWSNGDVSGKKSSWLILGFSLALVLVSLLPLFWRLAGPLYFIPVILLNLFLLWLAWAFLKVPDRKNARNVFLFTTLAWLPLTLIACVIGWKGNL